MFKKNLAMAIYSLFIPSIAHAIPTVDIDQHNANTSFVKGGKGQLRATQPKSSGAAQLKRQAKKRNNIRKHS